MCISLPLCLGGGHGLLSVVHELCLKCHKSLSQLFVCAEVVENAACLSQGLLGLSQGLVGQARWSGWSWLPSPFNRRSNTVANVMCNKTHFYCSPPGGQWIGAECGKREIPHSQRDGWWEAVLCRHRSERWPGVYGRNSEPLNCWWEGNSSSHTLVDKECR